MCRLQTIADYDKIVFVEEGQVVEIGEPIYLLAEDPVYSKFVDKDSYFGELVRQSGNAEAIFQIVKQKYYGANYLDDDKQHRDTDEQKDEFESLNDI